MKKFRKGAHEYVLWDKNTKQVRSLKKQKKVVRDKTQDISTVEFNDAAIFFNEYEFVIDFLGRPNNGKRRIAQRVILTAKTAKKLIASFKNLSTREDKNTSSPKI